MEQKSPYTNPYKDFQLSLDTESKSDEKYGLSIAKIIESTVYGTSNYYAFRNQQYTINDNWANGRVNVQAMFSDLLQFDGKFNYMNLSWECIMIVNRIITSLVGKWMGRNEQCSVEAIDPFSQKTKAQNYNNAEFAFSNKALISNIEQQSGVPIISQDQFVPEDKDELDSWAAEHNRLPEEILYQKGINNIHTINGMYDVIKEMLLHDSATNGFVGTYVEMGEDGTIREERVPPKDAFYSYSLFNDFRDTMWRGRVKSLRISELRAKYGKEFGGKLTEEQIFEIAQTSKDWQVEDKISWIYDWNNCIIRPYDEWNIDIMDFELKSVDNDNYTMKVTANGSLFVDKVNKRPENLGTAKKFYSKDKWAIYKGTYIPKLQIILEWGVKKNMIRPQDPKSLGDCEFSYSYYMYQNKGMRNLAIPQKIQEPVKMMILTRIKIQQVIAKLRPPGAMINEDALQAMDYGLGEKNKEVDPKAHFDQTGDIYYRGRDAQGNAIPVPIQELTNSGFFEQMQGLIQTYNYHYQVLKDELGQDPNLVQSALQPRVTSGNVDAAQENAEFATDYMYNAYLHVMNETSRKTACLLNDSVSFGAQAYRDILQEKDVKGKVFTTDMKMLPTKDKIAGLAVMMNNYITAFPDFMAYVDPFKIMRIAEQDVKEAELYFRQAQKRYLKGIAQKEQQNQQATFEAQKASNEQAAQAKQDELTMEIEHEKQKTAFEADAKNSNTALTSILKMYELSMQNNTQLPAELKPLATAVLQNVALPAMIKNEKMKMAIISQMQQAQQPQPMNDEGMEEMSEQPQDLQPQQNVA